jgi:hypothetical protein
VKLRPRHAIGVLVSLVVLAPLIYSPGEAGGEVWQSAELAILLASLPNGLACDDAATRILSIHRQHNAPLAPGQDGRSTLHTKALLGLVVQVRGQEYVQKNLEFDLEVRFGDLKRRYSGSWPGGASSRAVAKTTDWWIDLGVLFADTEIGQMCKSREAVDVKLVSYRFR